MNYKPNVSVFLPTYNQQNYIAHTIESILCQNYDNFEIIIGDDCSKDKTWEIVQQYQRNYPDKIKSFSNAQNLGITGNCNEILKRCSGKYIVFCAGDDLFLPSKINKQIDVMEKDETIILCYHDIEVFDSENGNRIRFWNQGLGSNSPIFGNSENVAKAVIEQGTAFMAAISVMVRSDAFPSTGFDSRIPVASDWLMWIEILIQGGSTKRVEYLSEVLSKYRRHNSNITNEGYLHTSDEFVTLAIVESKYPLYVKNVHKSYALIRYRFGINAICRNNFRTGRIFLLLSLLSGWVSWKLFFWLAASYLPSLLKLRTSK